MDVDNDSDAEDYSDLIYSLEQLRANPHLPEEVLRALEQAHDIFLRNVRQEPEVALQAYACGLTMGAYIAPQEALAETDRLLIKAKQSRRGKISGKSRRNNRLWTTQAGTLASQIRAEGPSLSQDDVASKISERWKEPPKCPGHPTLNDFISELEKQGKLPKRDPEKKKKKENREFRQ